MAFATPFVGLGYDDPSIEPEEYAARSLSLASHLLTAQNRSDADLWLAQALLRESVLSASRALSGDASIVSAADLRRAIDDFSALRVALGGAEAARQLTEAITSESPSYEPLRAVETAVSGLLVAIEQGRGGQKVKRASLWIAGFAVVAMLLLQLPLLLAPVRNTYKWTASSAYSGFDTKGTLDQVGSFELLFHTLEEREPWIVIDLEKKRELHNVIIQNRKDCCTDRGLPLLVETSTDGVKYQEAARQTTPFVLWDVPMRGRAARFVRLRALSQTTLHLSDVNIR